MKEDPTGDSIDGQCRKLKRQLDELVNMTTGLENRLQNSSLRPGERRNLESLRMRYAREALEMMMKIDDLEDPEDEDQAESAGGESM